MFSSASRQRRGIGEPPLVAGKGGLMKALYIDIKPERMLATRALARFSKNALFGPLAPLPGRRDRIYMGHVLVGEVVEVGDEVADLKVGDRVVQYRGGSNCLVSGRRPPRRPCA